MSETNHLPPNIVFLKLNFKKRTKKGRDFLSPKLYFHFISTFLNIVTTSITITITIIIYQHINNKRKTIAAAVVTGIRNIQAVIWKMAAHTSLEFYLKGL